MQRFFLAIVGVLLLSGNALAQPKPLLPPNVKRGAGLTKQLLRRMVQAELTLTFNAQEVTVLRDGRTVEQRVKQDPKRGVRRESLQPEGSFLVDDRHHQYLVNPKERRYVESASQLTEMQKRFQEGLRALGGTLVSELQGQDTIAGRATDVLLVQPPPDMPGPSRRFWIDRETGLRLRTEERDPSGRILSNTYFLTLELNPVQKDEEFTPPPVPPGFRRIVENAKRYRSFEEAAKEGVTLKQPSWLPMGFTLRHIVVAKEGRPRVTALWGNNLTAISLVSARGPLPPLLRKMLNGAESGFVQPPRGDRSYVWRTADGYNLLIGNLPDDQLKRIADSVH